MSFDLYREHILDHYQYPRNHGKLEKPDIVQQGNNPLCGDEIEIQVKLNGNAIISDIKFTGKGCAISQASTSILTEHVQNKSLEEVKKITRDDVISWLGIQLTPIRVKCAMLGFKTLEMGILHWQQQK